MKKKKLKNLTRGFVTVLPIVLFILILRWIFSWIVSSVSWLGALISENIVYEIPDYVINIISFVLLVFLVWLVGVIMNEKHLGHRLKKWFTPLVSKVPLLSTLFKITNQVTHTLQNTNSFRETVLLRFPTDYTYSVGFITGEDVSLFEGASKESHLVSVFVPTTPNPTNGYLVLVDPDRLIKTTCPVSTAVSFIISMGTTQEILESYDVSSWDFFKYNWNGWLFYYLISDCFLYCFKSYEYSKEKKETS